MKIEWLQMIGRNLGKLARMSAAGSNATGIKEGLNIHVRDRETLSYTFTDRYALHMAILSENERQGW